MNLKAGAAAAMALPFLIDPNSLFLLCRNNKTIQLQRLPFDVFKSQ
jgi:hypothetical protein